ncbi:MAG: sigma-70 family RNA polymerase sigma factor [Candidatus Pseudobacter hemicellulosilyticus]|uniref:Sigma-70 family RNA polymerase sigma factor n=1 Tax=Candidatus Pseudobacter hemicellulosilyticus TaxID=3121375 RepID=A0AAJ6BHT9_9BACT|nr:MAG: sigma-70 family RNA polymerase sigma factor [Pseudobacter sp.]
MRRDDYKYTPEEFSDLFKKYWGTVYTICYRYVQDADMAKDMVQNIFITLWERDHALRDPFILEKYLTKAAKYQVFKHARDSRSRAMERVDDLDETPADAIYNPHQNYLYQELTNQLQKQVALLHEPARTIFRMSRYEALSHKEIAGRMGIAIKTVEYHLSKSLRILRKMSNNRQQ